MPRAALVPFSYATCALEFGSAFYCLIRMNFVGASLYRTMLHASHAAAFYIFYGWVSNEGVAPRTWLPIAAIMTVLVIGREREARRIAPIRYATWKTRRLET